MKFGLLIAEGAAAPDLTASGYMPVQMSETKTMRW